MVKGFKPPSEKIPKAPAPRLSQRPVVEPGRIPRSPDLLPRAGGSKGMGGGGPGLPRGPSTGGGLGARLSAGRPSMAGGGMGAGPSTPPSAAPPPPDDAESGPNGNGGSGIGFRKGGSVKAKNTDIKRERLDDNKKKTHKQLNSDPKVRHW